jgi:hypothetical protein
MLVIHFTVATFAMVSLAEELLAAAAAAEEPEEEDDEERAYARRVEPVRRAEALASLVAVDVEADERLVVSRPFDGVAEALVLALDTAEAGAGAGGRAEEGEEDELLVRRLRFELRVLDDAAVGGAVASDAADVSRANSLGSLTDGTEFLAPNALRSKGGSGGKGGSVGSVGSGEVVD